MKYFGSCLSILKIYHKHGNHKKGKVVYWDLFLYFCDFVLILIVYIYFNWFWCGIIIFIKSKRPGTECQVCPKLWMHKSQEFLHIGLLLL